MKNKILDDKTVNLNLDNYEVSYKKAYLIAITPRSGSTLLCDLLSNTNLAGRPNEFLNPDFIKQRLTEYSDTNSLKDVYSKTIQYTMTENGVFGIKASYFQAEPFIKSHLFNKLFPNIKIINLFRRNILKQAISLYIAAETKFFHTGDDESNREERINNLSFDADKIFSRVKELYEEEQGWIDFLDVNAYSYIKLFYEDNIIDLERTIKTILMYVGIKDEELNKFVMKESKFKKISTGINEDFYGAFINDSKIMNRVMKMEIPIQRIKEDRR